MIQRAEKRANFDWGKAAAILLLPLLVAACQSTPAELASDLAEPAVVAASANPADAQMAEADAPPQAGPQSSPRELVSIPPQPKAAVEMEQLQAPNQAPHEDRAPEPKPQILASAAPGKAKAATRPEPALDEKAAARDPKSVAPTRLAEATPKSELASPAKRAGSFEWPVEGKILETYGADKDGQRNDGINIAADTGTPIHAAANGTVTYASNLKGYGNLVLIKHSNGYITAYAHAEKLLVSAGDRVGRGDVIGYAGKSGGVGTPQLHFEIRKGTKPVDPRPLMMSGRES